MEKLAPLPFYAHWKGHPIEDLSKVLQIVRQERGETPIIWLAGDSSLDNKAWVPSDGPAGSPLPVAAPKVYGDILKSPRPKPDVAFWLNHFFEDKATTINAAIEESLLRQRDDRLLPHDELIRDSIRPQDVLIVSVGGNDIAYSPLPVTAMHMLQVAWLASQSSLEDGTAFGLGYFKGLFGTKVQNYISQLVSKVKPAAVAVCMIYYPLESDQSKQRSWADTQLKLLRYDGHPEKLQAAIKAIYQAATKKIAVDGTTVVPVALFDAMDGKTTDDYVERVEPSVEGGRKMGELLHNTLLPFITRVAVTSTEDAAESSERQDRPTALGG